MKKNENGFSIVEILVVIVALGLIATVGWLVMDRQKTKAEEKKNAQAAQAAQQQQENTKKEAERPKARWTYSAEEEAAAKKFMDKYNNAALSRAICSNKPVNMFDIHIKDYQAVFRYKCDNSPKTWLAIFEQDSSSPEDWDLKVSNMDDGELPDWVYDRDVDFYKNSFGVVRES